MLAYVVVILVACALANDSVDDSVPTCHVSHSIYDATAALPTCLMGHKHCPCDQVYDVIISLKPCIENGDCARTPDDEIFKTNS